MTSYKVWDKVVIDCKNFTVVGFHPSISDVLIVESDDGDGVKYVRESRVTAA